MTLARYGSRKFLLSLLVILLVSLALTVYAGANVTQKAVVKQ